REGFVFAVNADNPVDSLTSEQLRKIYSGEITNWSEVGGNDEPILPYQRNTDSGSQNYMTVFMGDTPLLPPKTELTAGMMMALMDAIAVYDNSAGAIGYSVYSYAAQMYANANKVKFISVDGVAPSKVTMADESYPLLSCTYIIYPDKSPESAREFTEMALSDEGQGYVLDSGYLPVNGMDIPKKYLPYEAVGTGAPKPADFTPSREYSRLSFNSNMRGFIKSYDDYFEITFLKDEELQARINGDIRAAMDEIRKHCKPEYALGNNEYTIDGISISIGCRNGYLSLTLGYCDYTWETWVMEPIYVYHYAETLNYDLIEGTKIERFSDLFYEGEDFLPDVNQSIADYISRTILNVNHEYPGKYVVPKQDFSCILGEPRLFTFDSVGLEPDNLYFTCAPVLIYSDNYRHSMVSQYRDMSGLIADRYLDNIYEYTYPEWETDYTIENGDVYIRTTGSLYHTDEEVKAEDELWYDLQRRAWDTIRLTDPDWHSGGDNGYYADIATYRWKNYYSIGLRAAGMGENPFANFDRDTLELITIEMLLGDDWRQYCDNADIKLNYIPSEWSNNAETITILAYPDTPTDKGYWHLDSIWFEVPKEAVNERYRER
ncbi:MAG: substrate-binding domain-containing protein, partial [Oscillospiraceae bacterium]|nr:substrate-binding domain-containing protein [Oscillospiraceae bacterium]